MFVQCALHFLELAIYIYWWSIIFESFYFWSNQWNSFHFSSNISISIIFFLFMSIFCSIFIKLNTIFTEFYSIWSQFGSVFINGKVTKNFRRWKLTRPLKKRNRHLDDRREKNGFQFKNVSKWKWWRHIFLGVFLVTEACYWKILRRRKWNTSRLLEQFKDIFIGKWKGCCI